MNLGTFILQTSNGSTSNLNGSSSNINDLTSVLKRVLDKRRECRSDEDEDASEGNSLGKNEQEFRVKCNSKRLKNSRRRSLSPSSSRDSPSTTSCWSTSDEL